MRLHNAALIFYTFLIELRNIEKRQIKATEIRAKGSLTLWNFSLKL